jgi:cytochrome c biogenesis protein CcmG/thiol:disulfide interchange protein DsbE
MKTLLKAIYRTIPLIIFSLAMAFIANRYLSDHDAPSAEAELALKTFGEPAKEISLPSFTDRKNTWELSSLKGQGIILNFWATWCAPCIREIPSLIELSKQYKSKGLKVVAVSVDKDWETINRFFTRYPNMAEAKTEFVILLDSDSRFATEYGAYQFPESYLINRKFIVDLRLAGEQVWQDPRMATYYDRILKVE